LTRGSARSSGTADLDTDHESVEPPDQLYTPFVTWIRANPGRGVALAAAFLIAGQALIRGWFSFRGWFVGDDYAFMGRAATMPLFSWDYLMQSYGGHLMPGAYLYVAAMHAIAPMSYTPVVLVSIVVQALTAALLYQLLRNLFGTRPALLIPLTIYLFSPINLPAFLWWAAALNQLPQQLAIVTALLWHVKYLRTGRLYAGLLGVSSLVGGLLFSEKTIVAVPFIAALTVLFFTAGPPLQRMRTAAVRHRVVGLAYLVVVAGYAAFYLIEVRSPTRGTATSGAFIQTLGNQVNHAILPGLLGGPWTWQEISSNGAIANPGPLAIALSALVIVVLVATTILLRHRAVFGWLLLGGYVLVNSALLAITRVTLVGPLIGDEFRYVTDVCLLAVVCGSLATFPLIGEYRRAKPQRLIPRTWARARLTALSRHEAVALVPGLRPAPVIGAVVVALFMSSMVSTNGFDKVWHPNAGRTYIDNAERDLAEAPRDIVLLDTAAPPNVAWPLIYPFNSVHYLLAADNLHPPMMSTSTSATPLYMLDDTGHVRQADVTDGSHNSPGPTRNCGWRVTDQPARVPLVRNMVAWTWMVRIGYIASAEATTWVTAGTTSVKVPIHAGLNALFLEVQGPVDVIGFSGLSGSAALCTNEIRVGQPVAIPFSRP
jgi:hypothetical protein